MEVVQVTLVVVSEVGSGGNMNLGMLLAGSDTTTTMRQGLCWVIFYVKTRTRKMEMTRKRTRIDDEENQDDRQND